MRKAVAILFLAFAVGCGSTGTITQDSQTWESGPKTDLSIQRGINVIANGHDAYVNGDPTLTPEARAPFLQESNLVRTAFALQSFKTNTIRQPLTNVLGRYDAYLGGDPSLTPQKKDLLQYTSQNVRMLLEASH